MELTSSLPDEAFRQAIIDGYPGIVNEATYLSSELGAEYVKDALDLKDSQVIRAASPPVEALQANVRWAFSEGTDRLQAMNLLRDSMTRRINDGARHTITGTVEEIPGARYARYTRAGSKCNFCRMLATRGAVYGSKASAGGKGAKFHDGCHCTVVPVRRKRDYVLPQHVKEWKDQKIWLMKPEEVPVV